MGNYRTTLFRRDFNRLQAQRNQGFPKEPVSIKQGNGQHEKAAVNTAELDAQQIPLDGGIPLERDHAVSNGLANVNMDQMSAFSEDGRQVGQVHCVQCN